MKANVWTMDYGELGMDSDFVDKCENLTQQLMDIHGILTALQPLRERIDTLPLSDQIELDLFFVYTLNSLYFVKLRIEGVDLSAHPIKDELRRIKIVMNKWAQIKDRSLRPRVNIQAAKRFVRSGLFDRKHGKENTKPPNKKIRFND